MEKREKERITGKYRKMMEGPCRKMLLQRVGSEQEESFWKQVQETYSRILDEAPDLGGEANMMAHNFYQAAWLIALYEVLDKKLSAEEIEQLMQEVLGKYLKLLAKVPGHFLIRHKWTRERINRHFEKYQEKLKDHLGKDWHNTWGMEVYRDVEEGVHYGLRGCPIYDCCKERGAMAILPYLCNMDHTMLQAMHLYLIRPTTCSAGDEVCDYWCVADDSPEAARYPLREREDGLLLNGPKPDAEGVKT